MELSVGRPLYVIPSYSLTGDLLAYVKCGLQYRYHSRGALPPSRPVQLWFGEFIHAVMEEAYLKWLGHTAPRTFPWDWLEHVRPIELEVARRLKARGLIAPHQLYCSFERDRQSCRCRQSGQGPHKQMASRRTEATINTWGPHLFPLISKAEVRLSGLRRLNRMGCRGSTYYEATGTIDVIGSVQCIEASCSYLNLILEYLRRVPELQGIINGLHTDSYEVILDYKGMARPLHGSEPWQHHSWQVLTYSWLRGQQHDAAPVVAGIILYVNELEPSSEDMDDLREEVIKGNAQPVPGAQDRKRIEAWHKGQQLPVLSAAFREQRSIRVVPVHQVEVQRSLANFDAVVQDIEDAVSSETLGQGVIRSWQQRPSGDPYLAPEQKTCVACDFKHNCPLRKR